LGAEAPVVEVVGGGAAMTGAVDPAALRREGTVDVDPPQPTSSRPAIAAAAIALAQAMAG
jgi:hypothetical protein